MSEPLNDLGIGQVGRAIAALGDPSGIPGNGEIGVTLGYLVESPSAPIAELPAPWEAAPGVEVNLVEIPSL